MTSRFVTVRDASGGHVVPRRGSRRRATGPHDAPPRSAACSICTGEPRRHRGAVPIDARRRTFEWAATELRRRGSRASSSRGAEAGGGDHRDRPRRGTRRGAPHHQRGAVPRQARDAQRADDRPQRAGPRHLPAKAPPPNLRVPRRDVRQDRAVRRVRAIRLPRGVRRGVPEMSRFHRAHRLQRHQAHGREGPRDSIDRRSLHVVRHDAASLRVGRAGAQGRAQVREQGGCRQGSETGRGGYPQGGPELRARRVQGAPVPQPGAVPNEPRGHRRRHPRVHAGRGGL